MTRAANAPLVTASGISMARLQARVAVSQSSLGMASRMVCRAFWGQGRSALIQGNGAPVDDGMTRDCVKAVVVTPRGMSFDASSGAVSEARRDAGAMGISSYEALGRRCARRNAAAP